MDIDVTVVLNLHREAAYVRATLRSLEACVLAAQAAGIRCELVAVFDRSDALSRRVFDDTRLEGFAQCKRVEVDVGSLGLARNAGIAQASGEFVWTADADDLVSENAIVGLHRTAVAHGGAPCVVLMNYLVAFGEDYHVAIYYDSRQLTVADFAFLHPYVSRIFLRRAVFAQHRYRDLGVTTGYAYEDWDLIVRLRRQGFVFLIAPDTFFLYRQRQGSLVRQANAASARIIPHSEFFEPAWFVAELAQERQRVGGFRALAKARRVEYQRNGAREVMDSPLLRGELRRANALDPEVELERIEHSATYLPLPWSADHWGWRLADAMRMVGVDHAFTDVVLLPWLNPGGGEKYILQIVHQLAACNPRARFLVVCGQPARRHAWSDRLPAHSVLLDVYNAFPMLPEAERDLLVTRLLMAVTPARARLHIKGSEFAQRLIDTYGGVLLDHLWGIYYRFSDQCRHWHGFSIQDPSTTRFLRNHLFALDKVICDCAHIARQDLERFGFAPERYHVIYASTRPDHRKQAGQRPTRRLLWASRICEEKRPELLVPLIGKLRQDYSDSVIEIHGHADAAFNPARLFAAPGLEYQGAFDGFESLPVARYDALVYTSAYDGLPNIVLEALAAGLPVIAPDVGGIGEAVVSGQTGYLIPDESDEAALIGQYARAIDLLYQHWDDIPRMAGHARRLIEARHAPAVFADRVAEVFGFKALSPPGE